MSLKAKVEAIIYAAEEPITVEQIAQLLRDQILAEQARLEAEAQAAAEAKAAEDARSAAESTLTEDDNPALLLGENNGATADESIDATAEESPTDAPSESGETVEAAETSTPVADEVTPVEASAEPAAVENTPAAETGANQVQPEASTEAVAEEPSPAESASVDAPATPGKRQKKTKEELAVDAKVRAHVRALIGELIADYASEDRGIEVRHVAGGYRMSTKPEHHDVVRAFAKSLKPPVRLSLAALETLAVIAYKQPITVPEISEIRGVESGGVIATLLDRKLVTTAGRKQVIGRPILYKTAKEFLLRFGLNDVSELPSMEEFEKLAAEGLGGEEQTKLDLQSPTQETISGSGDKATAPLTPEEGLSEAPAPEANAVPAEEPSTAESVEAAEKQQETAPVDEKNLEAETQERQQS